MSDGVKVRPIEETEVCQFCGSSRVASRKTSFASGISSGSVTKARHGTYQLCDNCGVTYMQGDYVLVVDGEKYLLHPSDCQVTDQLAGKLATGPWGTALEPGERPGDRVILSHDDVHHDTGADILDHIEEVAAAVRAKRPS